MSFQTDQITPEELEEANEYFERLYLLDHLGELRPGQMLEDDTINEYASHTDQLKYDLERLEQTSLETLPEEYKNSFATIDRLRASIDVRDPFPGQEQASDLSATDARERIEEYVRQHTAEDDERGVEVTEARRLYHAKSYEHELRGHFGIGGVLDSTYILDII